MVHCVHVEAYKTKYQLTRRLRGVPSVASHVKRDY